MKAFQLTGIRKMRMNDVPDPKITDPGDVLIRMKSLGVCGSDIHYYLNGKIGSQVVSFPFTTGHEGAGIVKAAGDGVTRVKPGDLVAIDPAMPCFHCDQCLTGRLHTCRNLRFLGNPGQADGCLSEYVVMPETSCYVVPGGVNADEAAFIEPLSIGTYAVHLAGNVEGKNIGILGSGPIGISVLMPALAYGARHIYVTDKIPERLALARKTGAYRTGNPDKEDIVAKILDNEPGQLDVVFECCGKQEAVDQAVQLVKPGGMILIIGIPGFDIWTFPADELRHKEITIRNVRRQNNCIGEALDLIRTGKVDVDRVITHLFPFEKSDEAYDLVAGYRDGVMKAMIRF
ncbi:MAG: alcohol dehydrogenase catalytic domain-containing protein [Chlorobi bacterium]|nr:alcohol dehydrogenase catalytic domain-containing protein [Chlorobiota bacterium]